MTENAPLEVRGMCGGQASLGNGDRCVSLVVTSSRGLSAGLVLTPDDARTLAESLTRQARFSEAKSA